MKNDIIVPVILVLSFVFFVPFIVNGQDPGSEEVQIIQKKSLIVKQNGARFIGVILSRDERELFVDTDNMGRLYIPLHEIAEIKEIDDSGSTYGKSLFSTRYFLTTNGPSMTKGDKYGMLNYYGPEAHFAVADDFTLGVMTTWAAMPLVGSAKYTIHFDENAHLCLGALFGTLSWIKIDAAGFLGYGAFTLGNYENNFTISAGYVGITADGDGSGAPLMSIAFLFRLGENIHFVGDSFIYLGEEKFTVLVPGLRFERPYKRSSIQIGIGGAIIDGEAVPIPIPVFSWFYEL
ncbi:MAG: hypothetical protein K8R35_07415 [Bacteroidales bacterium]|nr:hypothetical protein [Bacteroidales bacterium]